MEHSEHKRKKKHCQLLQIDVACKAYHQEVLEEDSDDGDDAVSPRVVGHNIYILCHQLALYNKQVKYKFMVNLLYVALIYGDVISLMTMLI